MASPVRKTCAVTFSIEDYTRITGKLDVEGVDFDSFAPQPLDAATLRCLRYMHDVEHHTICYLRDLLVTRVHRDPEITTFLTFWSFEEYWHGEAIGRVLEAHGEAGGVRRIAPMRARLGRRDRLGPVTSMLSSALTGEFTAVHMTWGAINEWSTQAGYARLAAKARHPVLTDLLRRIMRQEGRHIDFYSSEARKRLARSRTAQRMTRLALRRFWTPVGAGVMPKPEVDFLITHLFDDDEGRQVAARIDRRIDGLPGLEGLGLAVRAIERYHWSPSLN